MKKLRRPATREEAEQFGTTMKAVFEELGVGRGQEFIVAKVEPGKPYAPDGLAFSRGSDTSRDAARNNLRFRRDGQHYKAVVAMYERGERGIMRTELAEILSAADGTASTRLLELRENGFAEIAKRGGAPVTRRTPSGNEAEVNILTPLGVETAKALLAGEPISVMSAPGSLREQLDEVEPEVVDAEPVDEPLFEPADRPLSAYHPDVA